MNSSGHTTPPDRLYTCKAIFNPLARESVSFRLENDILSTVDGTTDFIRAMWQYRRWSSHSADFLTACMWICYQKYKLSSYTELIWRCKWSEFSAMTTWLYVMWICLRTRVVLIVHLLSSKVNNGSRTSMISEYWDEPIFVKRSLYIKIYRLEKIVPCCDAASKFFSSRHTPSWHSCIDVKYTSIWGLSV